MGSLFAYDGNPPIEESPACLAVSEGDIGFMSTAGKNQYNISIIGFTRYLLINSRLRAIFEQIRVK